LLKNKTIWQESFWAFFGQSLSVVAIIAGIRVITEFVSPEHYGQYVIFSGISLLVFNVISGSIFQSFLRIIPEQNDKKAILLSSKIVILFTILSFASLSLYLISKLNFYFLVFLFFAYLISEHFVGFYKVLMNIKKEQKKYAIFQILLSSFRPIISVLLYIFFEQKFTSIIFGFLLANLLISFLFFGKKILHDLNNALHEETKLKQFSNYLNYSKPLSIQKIFGWSLNNIDKYIVAFFFGTDTVGKYAPIVSLMSMLYQIFSEAINIIFRPYYFEKIAQKKVNSANKVLKIYGSILLASSVFFIIIFTLFNEEIVNLVLGENFRSYYYLLPMLSISFTFLVFGYLFATICLAYKKTWLVFKIEGIAAIANLLILPLAIYTYGIDGIPIAILFTYLTHCIVGLISIKGINEND
tara:strand:- start:808 stop:2043 length:1236 start_codon:yes stop_codon:yes gene_type:complete